MKAVAIFLSFYIVLLSAIPCVDEVRHNASQKVELSPNTTNSHPNDIDHCSPFCSCQCCQATFCVVNTPVLSPSEASGIIHYEYVLNFHSIDLFDFLIPPKS